MSVQNHILNGVVSDILSDAGLENYTSDVIAGINYTKKDNKPYTTKKYLKGLFDDEMVNTLYEAISKFDPTKIDTISKSGENKMSVEVSEAEAHLQRVWRQK